MNGIRILLLTAGLAGCVQVPELDERIPAARRTAPYPDLIPLDGALGAPVDPEQEATELQETLEVRSAALRSRAGAVQAPVIDEDAKDRLQEAIDPQ